MNLYYKIIYLFLNKEIFEKYKNTIDLNIIKGSMPIIYKVFLSLFKLHERTTNNQASISVKDLETVFFSLYPAENQKEIALVFNHIERDGSEANKELLVSYLNDCQTRLIAFEIAKLGITTSDGGTSPETALQVALVQAQGAALQL